MEEWIRMEFEGYYGDVLVTLTGGRELEGQIVAFQDKYLLLRVDGSNRPVSYDLIGMCEKIGAKGNSQQSSVGVLPETKIEPVTETESASEQKFGSEVTIQGLLDETKKATLSRENAEKAATRENAEVQKMEQVPIQTSEQNGSETADSKEPFDGYLVMYVVKSGYGFIKDKEVYTGSPKEKGNRHFQLNDVINLPEDGLNTMLYHYKVRYSKEVLAGNPRARAIEIVDTIPVTEKVTTRKKGYIMKCLHSKQQGYIIEESEYDGEQPGHILFDFGEYHGNSLELNTFANHYYVEFTEVYIGGRFIAKDIELIREVPFDEVTSTVSVIPTTEEDINAYTFKEGESLYVQLKDGTKVFGEFAGKTEDRLTLLAGEAMQQLPLEAIQEIYYIGLITEYNVLTGLGKINGRLEFKGATVVDKQLAHMLNLGKQGHTLCLYSLVKDGGQTYIKEIIYFSKEILMQLPWKTGTIQGLYEKDNYITVNGSIRCYITQVKDNIVNRFVQSEDFLGQTVFYKSIHHQRLDERRPEGISESIVEIRSWYQEGKVKAITADGLYLNIQCGSQIYRCGIQNLDLMNCEVSGYLKLEDGILFFDSVYRSILGAPSHKQEFQEEKGRIDQAINFATSTGDIDALIRLNKELLEKQFVVPENAMERIFRVCLENDRMKEFSEVLLQYGFLLRAWNYQAYLFQSYYLNGEKAEAVESAKLYLRYGTKDEIRNSLASGILSGTLTEDELREAISKKTEVASVARIGYYHAATKTGYIVSGSRKLNFSYKDLVGFEDTIDLEHFEYLVSFAIDSSKSVARATNIEIKSVIEIGTADGDLDAYELDFETDSEDLELSGRVTSFLEFVRDNYRFDDIAGYLPDQYRKLFRGDFVGNKNDARKMIEDVRPLIDREKSSSGRIIRKKTVFDEVEYGKRPNVILAAAKLQKLFADENDPLLCEEQGRRLLLGYAYRYLAINTPDKDAETEYYCESVSSNPNDRRAVNVMEARCVIQYFDHPASFDLNRCGHSDAVKRILARECKEPMGYLRMLLNLPKRMFDDLISCSEDSLIQLVLESAGLFTADESTNEESVDSELLLSKLYEDYHKQLNQSLADLLRAQSIVSDTPHLFSVLESLLNNYGKYLFEMDRKLIGRVADCFNTMNKALLTEELDIRTSSVQSTIPLAKSIIRDVEQNPTKLSFETFRPLMIRFIDDTVAYLTMLYSTFAPRLTVSHCTLRENGRREVLEIANEEQCLAAENVRIVKVEKIGDETGFAVELGNRSIEGNGGTASRHHPSEISIPINMNLSEVGDLVEIRVTCEYWYCFAYDSESDIVEKNCRAFSVDVQIPLKDINEEYITENPYAFWAGGQDMAPDKQFSNMFYGRDEDIKNICGMIFNADGTLKEEAFVAIFGQKRCGKTSVKNFLGAEIRRRVPDALILDINLQKFAPSENQENREYYYTRILGAICTEMRIKCRSNSQLMEAMAEYGLKIPKSEDMKEPFFNDMVDAFFNDFRAIFKDRYPIVLMADEFTQIYIYMKERRIPSDFLNRWRAMIKDYQFVNVTIGQDFLEKFETDSDITKQNYGAAVNGLGTMNKKRLSYLDKESAFRMMDEPIYFSDGTSRYQRTLGQDAKKLIFNLTGGSAFYLMKFCNGLVDYMMLNKECLITPSLVQRVATGHVFDMGKDPLGKRDFDPIFNEFSAKDDVKDAQEEERIAAEESEKTFAILKQIAKKSSSEGLCLLSTIEWPNLEERERILRSLVVRTVLVDPKGRDIPVDAFSINDNVRIKVGIFAIWLRERG